MARISSRRAFTLIELLIVIAIIGILMALLFPAVGSALDAGRKTAAKNDVVQIANAVSAYEVEYGKLPGNPEGDDRKEIDSDLVKILTAEDTDNNPRKIVFIEIGSAKKNSKSGTNGTGKFVDPWGNQYYIRMDGNYDNKLEGEMGQATSKTNELRKKVAVWNEQTNTVNKRRNVVSWE